MNVIEIRIVVNEELIVDYNNINRSTFRINIEDNVSDIVKNIDTLSSILKGYKLGINHRNLKLSSTEH